VAEIYTIPSSSMYSTFGDLRKALRDFLIEVDLANQDRQAHALMQWEKNIYAPTSKGVEDIPVMGDRDLRVFQVGETCQESSFESIILELDNVSSCHTAFILSDIVEEGFRSRLSRHWLRYDLPLQRWSHFIARALSRVPGFEGKAASSIERVFQEFRYTFTGDPVESVQPC